MASTSNIYTIHCSICLKDNIRLDKMISMLIKYLPMDFSRSQIEKVFKSAQVNGKLVKRSFKVGYKDELYIELDANQLFEDNVTRNINDENYTKYYHKLDIIFDDEYLMVINKERGMVVHPGIGNTRNTLAQIVFSHLESYREKDKFNNRAGIVHRLDKDTSGVIVIAKTARMHDKLTKLFSSRHVYKAYIAIVKGIPKNRNDTIETYIGRHPKMRKKFMVVASASKGKIATTEYRVLYSNGDYSVVFCILHTGRTHQIRVHMQHLGSPIVGDTIYARDNTSYSLLAKKNLKESINQEYVDKICPLMLHSLSLSFDVHMYEDIKEYKFIAPIPKDMQYALDMIGAENILNTI